MLFQRASIHTALLLLLALLIPGMFLAQSSESFDAGKPQFRIVAVESGADAAESVSNTASVLLSTRVFIPSAFTPDNDGINDEFGAVGTNLEDYNLQIFDRWGEAVFESRDASNKWDGSYRNQAPQSGVYLYQFEAIDRETGQRVTASGTVTLFM